MKRGEWKGSKNKNKNKVKKNEKIRRKTIGRLVRHIEKPTQDLIFFDLLCTYGIRQNGFRPVQVRCSYHTLQLATRFCVQLVYGKDNLVSFLLPQGA